MLKLLRSTSVRIAFLYAGLFIVFSLILVGFLWWRTTGYLDREIDAVVIADTQAIGDGLRTFGLPGAIRTINDRVGETADEHAIYLLADPSLSRIAGNMDAWPAEVRRDPGWYMVDLVRGGKSYETRILHVVLANNFHLLVGRDVQDRVVIHRLILGGLSWASLTAFLLAVAGGLLVRRAVLRRVAAINGTALAIVRGDLSRRVPTSNSDDEFDQLAHTINSMLHQIEILVESVRNASNAVAHDLRTPLAELRARLEELLRSRPAPDVAFEQIHGAVGDIDRLIDIFNALLRLADLDSGTRSATKRQVDLAELADEVAELYGPLAEEKEANLVVDAPVGISVMGEPVLLAQALGNLVDNAVKYTPENGTILLRLARRPDGKIEIAVADRGPGIPDAEKTRVTERFYRGDASRGTPGIGLGLSVVAAVARLHEGELVLADNHPGLIASLILPAA